MKTVLLDFDGVIRHWTGSEIDHMERSMGLRQGIVFDIAFSDEFLIPAITGLITDEIWRENVQSELKNKYDGEIAQKLMTAWESASYEIDLKLLESIKSTAGIDRLVLASNGTSRLHNDLRSIKVDTFFDLVANSSDYGFAKPCLEYYEKVLTIAECCPSQCIFIDDTVENITAAENIGISCELYTTSDRALEFINESISD